MRSRVGRSLLLVLKILFDRYSIKTVIDPSPMRLSSVLCLLLIAAALVAAVDRNNFRPCSKASFCRRNRALKVRKKDFFLVECNSFWVEYIAFARSHVL